MQRLIREIKRTIAIAAVAVGLYVLVSLASSWITEWLTP